MGRTVSLGVLLLFAIISGTMMFVDPALDWKRLSARSPIAALRIGSDLDLETKSPELYQRLSVSVSNYNYIIEKDHLLDGMVTDRLWNGRPESVCDSLLFSGLRYVALKKMGYEQQALKAWLAIEKSQYRGQWFRHPACATQSTSRDMIVGLLAALSQKPPRYRSHLNSLIETIRHKKGYIGTGRFYVSLLTPGLAEIIRIMAIDAGIPEDTLPRQIRQGFSTLSFDSVMLQRGYTSHLNSLVLWLELELLENLSLEAGRNDSRIRTIFDVLDGFGVNALSQFEGRERREWIAYRLVKLDSENLFFRWLLLKTRGELDADNRAALGETLLKMSQFPKSRLPADCDRKADYMWQRDSREYKPQTKVCGHFYSGVDFLWMASLLLE